jgi:hypothetical protein
MHQPLRVVGLGKELGLEPAARRVGIGALERGLRAIVGDPSR